MKNEQQQNHFNNLNTDIEFVHHEGEPGFRELQFTANTSVRDLQELKSFIRNNKRLGFDEIAFKTGQNKDFIKKTWNKMALGFKHIPRTMIRFDTFTVEEKHSFLGIKWTTRATYYAPSDDLVVFLSPTMLIVIPAGVPVNQGSIPKIFRMFIEKDDPDFKIAFTVHDALYITKIVDHRDFNDDVLDLIAFLLEAPRWKRVVVRTGLFVGSWMPWHFGTIDETERKKWREATTEATLRYWKHNAATLYKIRKYIHE